MNFSYPFRNVRFCFLNGVKEVHAEEGGRIRGLWKTKPSTCIPKPGVVVTDFVNVRGDPSSIEQFTRRYGPLQDPYVLAQRREGKFGFSIEYWLKHQERIRRFWKHLAELKSVPCIKEKPDHPFDTLLWDYEQRCLTYTAGTLIRFLEVDLLSVPFERLRLCAREGCPNPFFIAYKLKMRYCSEQCSWEGMKKSKREWYHRQSL